MTRLAAYLVRVFSGDAIALFAIVSFLLFLAQALRSFDLVTIKGQDLPTLVVQTLLSMPTLVIAFAYVCIGIGLARGLRALRLSHELQVIHASRRTRALFGAIATYTLVAAGLVIALTSIVDPVTKRYFNARQSDIAAELVSRTLTPGRFIEMAPGVTLVIGSRGANGEIGRFFADDVRTGGRRTFIAESATLAADERGFVIKLRNGAIQYMSADARYSEIAFASYDLAIDRLSSRSDAPAGIDEETTPALAARLLAGDAPRGTWQLIINRALEGFRVIAMCLMVTAIAAFPGGERRGERVPLEIVVILAAFAERGLSAFRPLEIPMFPVTGSLAIAIASIVAIALKLRGAPAARLRAAQ